jgi:N-acetylglucosamine-6-phosphate deacetylase
MTVAPELPGALELIARLSAAGIVASIGHTDASGAQVREAVRAGATAATHVFNGMTPFHHRNPGVVGAVADLAEVSCELICDGVHIDPAALRMFYRAKGVDGIRLVTDAISAAGMPDGEYPLGTRTVIVSYGRAVIKGNEPIAGSVLTMESAVQNAVRFLGIPIEEAVLISSTNAARLLGLGSRKGAIAPGLDADLLVLGDQLSVEATMVAGRWITAPP